MIWEVGGKIHWLLASIETPAYARIFCAFKLRKGNNVIGGGHLS